MNHQKLKVKRKVDFSRVDVNIRKLVSRVVIPQKYLDYFERKLVKTACKTVLNVPNKNSTKYVKQMKITKNKNKIFTRYFKVCNSSDFMNLYLYEALSLSVY